jgi:UTP--glucose-1-phosphate uridylyltransferase
MGTAIERVEGAQAIHVPRSRFRPVKTTNELLLVRSDIFELDDTSHVVSVINRAEPFVDLDDDYYKFVPEFEQRFADGVPSMKEATSLRVRGDVTFGAGVVCIGEVVVDGKDTSTVPIGARLVGRT